MADSGMLTRFIQLFIDIFNMFVPADFPLADYFRAIIVLVVICVSIVGASYSQQLQCIVCFQSSIVGDKL